MIRYVLLVLIAIVVTAEVGCSRARYRRAADADTYAILTEKTIRRPWNLPDYFSIAPDPRSRFAQLAPLDDPSLPIPAPRLYNYQLPSGFFTPYRGDANPSSETRYEEVSLASSRTKKPQEIGKESSVAAGLGMPEGIAHGGVIRNVRQSGEHPAPPDERTSSRRPAREAIQASWESQPAASIKAPQIQLQTHVESEPKESAQKADLKTAEQPGDVGVVALALHPPYRQAQDDAPNEQDPQSERLPSPAEDANDLADEELDIVPIPAEVWNNLPLNVLERMFEFASIRDEYEKTFQELPSDELRDQSPRLSLDDIIELALINSREYQAQKENLYRVALRLTQERFNYELRFSPTGQATDVNFTHNRNGGQTINNLGVPTTVSGGKAMNIGGDLLARFANDVVLTFNGPNGFTADVGSDLFLNFSYSVLQRDVQFESLTQSERDVVYAARDFARFRKTFFVGLTSQYYSLVQTYRSIEISSQNYLSLVRAFIEADAEYRATGGRPRIEVDQVEQNALAGRSNLISSCNSLTRSLDTLKLAIGIPPETMINLDLTELFELTRRDEATVKGELVKRSRRVLEIERRRDAPNRAELINGALNLSERMLELIQIREEEGVPAGLETELNLLGKRLTVEESLLAVRFNREVLTRELAAIPPAPPLRIYQRTMDLVDSILELVQTRITLLEGRDADESLLEQLRQRRTTQLENAKVVRSDLDLTNIPVHVTAAQTLLADVEDLLTATERVAGYQPRTPEQEQMETIQWVDDLLNSSVELERAGESGLIPVEIEMNEAMLTALVQRFDLLNQRGELADVWRRIKIAGDDLRSVLNLNATQSVRTDPNYNRGFDFTWDESTTNLRLQFDTPLNRQSQRNAYRSALINYQLALRALTELEDRIKADVRDDLRNIQVSREQYRISVQSAALARERVVSTQLQLELGIAGVAARDYLEAQQAYAGSLNAVASNHIDYILLRMQIFLNMESLVLNEDGFWSELYEERVQPQPVFQFDPRIGSAYGELPPQLHYSRFIRRMNSIPNGQPMINQPVDEQATNGSEDGTTPASPPSSSNESGAPEAKAKR